MRQKGPRPPRVCVLPYMFIFIMLMLSIIVTRHGTAEGERVEKIVVVVD